MTDNDEQSRQRWVDDVEKALSRTSDAVKAAWEGTRESRMSALERAKEAASRLGDAIDQGLEIAKRSWDRPGATEDAGESDDHGEEE